MKLAPKLLAAPLATAIIVMSVGVVNTFQQHRSIQGAAGSFKEGLVSFQAVVSVEKQLGGLHAQVYRTVAVIASMDETAISAFRKKLKSQTEQSKAAVTTLSKAHPDNAELSKLVQLVNAQLDQYASQADQAIDLSSVDPNTGIAALQSADASFRTLSEATDKMVGLMSTHANDEAQQAADDSLRSSILLSLLGLLSAAAAVTMSWWMQRRMVKDLQHACHVADQVAQGRLNIHSNAQRQDELGDLLRSLEHMTQELSCSLRTVQESSQSIHTASVEIASGNNDLSSRTEQAASNLQETASSMQHLTDTVQHSSESASEANQLAQAAAQVADRGGQVVAQVVSTMEDISASSRRIGDIIGTIDSIAFQTNILALNAAVEAARAGEQGRGFAVVAGEVRSLAQRSASAAHEIKQLIGSSVERVATGAKLVADAGSTMEEIVASVRRVSSIVAEISAASTDQNDGIHQVNTAVYSLEQVTQQNAALVEQSAAAAESLKEQATRLGEVVARFQLGSHTRP